MNEQLEQAMVEILNRTINGIDASVGFMESQLPEVIEQLLTWYMVKSLAVNGWSILLLGAIIFATYKSYKFIQGRDPLNYPHILLPLLFFSVGAGIHAFSTINLEWLQIWVAPKIWLMEYAANIVK